MDGREMQKKIVVIEQPSFFSWCGYFGLIELSDIFVFYDDVQFERRSWQSRNRILNKDTEWMYINVPTVKAPQKTPLNEIKISYTDDWIGKLLSQIKNQYGKAPYYDVYIAHIERVLQQQHEYLADLNIALIMCFCDLLGMSKKEFLRSSEINGIEGAKSERLLNLMDALGETVYLSSTGARGYIVPEEFKNRKVDLYWFEFVPEEYEQKSREFVPYMSIIDALFQIGAEETKKYIARIAHRSMYRPS